MAKGIQDIGDGFGYLYMTDVTGTNILATQPNTVSGVRNMRQQGTSTAPIVANRPAVGTITVNSTAGAGSITAITIYGINQIGANIVVTSAVPSVVAGQIAAAINAFTASPVDFTAQAVNDVVYVFSPANAQPGYPTYNGAVITVSTTVPSIVTTTTDTTNGSTQFGNSYDDVFGFRFYLDADYGVAGIPGSTPASPTSLLYAIEVTDYFTVRGMQSGIVTTNSTIASDRIIGLTRKCAFTQIIVDTEASAASDVVAFIQTEGFVEGDEIRLRNTVPSRVPVLEDASVSTSPIATKNLYLTNLAPFTLSGYLSINLQLRNDPTLGFIWIETGRSEVVNGVIIRNIASINADIVAGLIKPNALYQIVDIGPRGAFVQGLTSTEIATTATMGRRVPRNYNDTWRTNIVGGVTIGNRYRYYQTVYRSLTGVLGTAPPSSPDWVAETGAPYYKTEQHTITLNIQDGIGINPAWPFIQETDSNNNSVSMSYDSFVALGINAFDTFPWTESANTQVRDNKVADSVFDAYQFTRPNDLIAGNQISSNTLFNNCNPITAVPSIIKNNIWSNAQINANKFRFLQNNRVINSNVISNAATALSLGLTFIDNAIEDSEISFNEHNASGLFYIEKCILSQNSLIQNCTISLGFKKVLMQTASTLNGLFIKADVQDWSIINSYVQANIQPTIQREYYKNSFINNIFLNLNDFTGPWTNTIGISGSIFTNCITINLVPVGPDDYIYNSTFNQTIFYGCCGLSSFDKVAITGPSYADVYNNDTVSKTFSTHVKILDMQDPSIYSANTLTIPQNTEYVGTFILNNQTSRTIDFINRPGYGVWSSPTELYPTPRFIIGGPGGTYAPVTFNTTARATATDNEIIGDAASYVINCITATTGLPYAQDEIWIRQINRDPNPLPPPLGVMYAVVKYNSYL